MKTLSERLNEATSRSAIRAYRKYESNPPKWYNIDVIGERDKAFFTRGNGVGSYMAKGAFNDMIDVATDLNSLRWNLNKAVNDSELEIMMQSYLEEYIDLKFVPITVIAGMYNDLLKKNINKIDKTIRADISKLL